MHNDLKRRTQLLHLLPLVLVFVLAAHALVLTYFFLHEAGHALVVYSFGGKLTAFKVGLWESHYSYQGQFSAFQNSLRTSAGVLFPILVWLIALFWMHRRVAVVPGCSLADQLRLTPCYRNSFQLVSYKKGHVFAAL